MSLDASSALFHQRFRVKNAFRVKGVAQGPDCQHPQLTFLNGQEARVIFADTVLMTDGAAVAHDQFRGCVLEVLPARQGFFVAVCTTENIGGVDAAALSVKMGQVGEYMNCLLYTSPSPRDGLLSRMPSSA